MYDLDTNISGASKRSMKQKGFKYLSHVPGDEGHDPAREVGTSNWVFSYADMMTSMVVFLLMLLAFSQLNQEKLAQVSESARKMEGIETTTVSDEIIEQKDIEPTDTPEQPEQPATIAEIASAFEQNDLLEGVQFDVNAVGATVSIKDSVLFESGRSFISGQAKQNLAPVFDLLKKLPENHLFNVEGHTDDNPINTFRYASNWELSAARALAVLQLMRDLGFDEERLSFQGFGEYRPLLPNRDEKGRRIIENQSQNRRAVIRITKKP